MTGRRTALTPEVQRRIVEAIGGGNFLEQAAVIGGISVSTFHAWMARGRAEAERVGERAGRKPRAAEAPFLDFLEAVTRARAEVEARNIAQLQRAAGGGAVVERRTLPDGTVVERTAPPDWRANGWWLERSFPQRWGRRVKVDADVTVRDGDKELDEQIAALLEARAGGAPEAP